MTRCWVLADGTVYFPHHVLLRLDWTYLDTITVGYIESPLTLLFSRRRWGRGGCKLLAAAANGGIIRCHHLLAGLLARTERDAWSRPPIFPVHSRYEVGLLLQPIDWQHAPFSLVSFTWMPRGKATGIYVLSGDEGPVYIGQGQIAKRLRTHTRRRDFKGVVHTMHWITTSKPEAVTLERLLLADFEARFGHLPRFNRRHT